MPTFQSRTAHSAIFLFILSLLTLAFFPTPVNAQRDIISDLPFESCITPGEVFTESARSLKSVELGAALITPAVLPDGSVAPLSVIDCSADKTLDVVIPWTESTAQRLAQIVMSPNLCRGLAPKEVGIQLIHGTSLILRAYDEKGNLVDEEVSKSSSSTSVLYTLSSASGIRSIQLIGAEICLQRICWNCEEPDVPVDNCVTAGDVYSAPASDQSVVNLGAAQITAGVLPTGAPAYLSVNDCSSDKQLDVIIPWSESTGRLATIIMSPNLCGGNAPQQVTLELSHGTDITLYAYDDGGNLVDTVGSASSSASVETFTLQSASGIRLIEVEGAEICLIRLCWECEIEIIPDDNCVTAGDVYTSPASQQSVVNLGAALITTGVLPTGDPAYLSVNDCSGDKQLDVVIPWSESTGRLATILMSPNLCSGNAPQQVTLELIHGTGITLYAYDDSGNLVDTVGSASSSASVETFTLKSASGIRLIEVEGAEICLIRLCWECEIEIIPDDNCVTPGDVYSTPGRSLDTVNLGDATITAGALPTGEPVLLDVVDCSGDGQLDVSIPWSESTGTLAQIFMSPNLCGGRAPQQVTLELIHGTGITLTAYDDSGNMVDSVGSASSSSSVEIFTLQSASGIRIIEIDGAEICLTRICWECEITITPELPNCVSVSEIYKKPTEVRVAELGGFHITPQSALTHVPTLQITDCSENGELGVFIGSSSSSSASPAAIHISSVLCRDSLPTEIVVYLNHYNQATLRAYDAAGVLVDTAVAAPHSNTQALVLSNAGGIRRIEFIGAEICITRICWSCDKPTEEPRPDEREWYSLDPNAKPGSPITPVVRESNEEQTTVELAIPGFWLKAVEYGGRQFIKVELPELAPLEGLGFERGDEWYNFPKETYYPPLSRERYVNALNSRIRQPIFPEKLKELQDLPRTGSQMEELGIDPAGARPGIPMIAGWVGVNPQSSQDALVLKTEPSSMMKIQLEAPVAPAGYTGLDQTAPEELQDYIPPELVDLEFYEQFEGEYSGSENPLSPITRNGAFSIMEVRTPAFVVNAPDVISVPSSILLSLSHPEGVLSKELPEKTSTIGWDAWVQKPAILNGYTLKESLLGLNFDILPIRFAQYLILTPAEYVDQLDDFIDLKRSKGLSVAVRTVGSSDTDDLPADRDAIDEYLEDAYASTFWQTRYVLIIGDQDLIPSGRTNRIVASPDASNGDSDHVYEVIGNDRLASLYVGRLSVNSADELDAQLAKIIQYERGSVSGNWPTIATLLANSENDDGTRGVSSSFPSKYAQAVNEIANYSGYNSNAPTFEVMHAGASNNSADRAVNDDVIDALEEGRGQLLYRGHGSTSSWIQGWDGSSSYGNSFDSSNDVPQLDNTVHPIVYSIACVNNRIRNDDSFGEEWMSRDGSGSVGFWSATVNSYTSENHNRAKGVFRAIYESGQNRLAPALSTAELISWGLTGDSGSWDNNTFCYLLLGDPEMTIRQNRILPRFTLVTDILRYREGSIVQVIGDDKLPVSAALVNIELMDGSFVNGFTNTKGQLVLDNISPESIRVADIFAERYPWFEWEFELPTPEPVVPDPIWVDSSNTSGIENGSAANPYDTIAEAMAVAATHTIRVRSGVYAEAVSMKDGVKLIGSGAESTVIENDGTQPVVSCLNIGGGSIISGFTLRNGSVGVLCTNSSPTISETIITGIVGGTSGDGIRLDNSSPDIRHNVIADVSGMGIRAQGASEPDIINNTIIDVDYYAGIAFAALNIGAVNPVIKNNIIVRGNEAPVSGIAWAAPASPSISYNNVYGFGTVPGSGNDYAYNDGSVWSAGSGGPGALNVDPLFTDDGAGNSYYLSPVSPCIDAGDPATIYNDVDGSRNDMGAYGGQRRDAGGGSHAGSGFLFTTIGRIPVDFIEQDSSSSNQGLATVPSGDASAHHIPAYEQAPFGGNLWIYGLFGASDPVDYYQLTATPLDGGAPVVLNRALAKTHYREMPDGSISPERVRLGPLSVGGIENLYRLNKDGVWSQQDLRAIWNTTGFEGGYTLTYRAYRQVSETELVEVTLPDNTQDSLTVWIDNSNIELAIHDILYADGSSLVECEDILLPHVGSDELMFNITASHPNGFLRSVVLDCYWGHNHYGGQFVGENYSDNASLAPYWGGFANELLSPMQPRSSSGIVPWQNCAYRFRLAATARTTDGFRYIKRDTYNAHHAVTLNADGSARIALDDCPDCDKSGPSPFYELAGFPEIAQAPAAPRLPVHLDSLPNEPVIEPFQLGDDPQDFVDNWLNVDPDTSGITRIEIDEDMGNISVHAFGQCVPTDCDWGEVSVPASGNPFTAFYDHGFATRTLTIQLIDANTLQVHKASVFHDGSGRDYEATYVFERGTIWVDDDNDSGTEDGTRAFPFDTIGEGVAAASSGQIVRVLSGDYPEPVMMKDRVSLIGDGASSTVIRPGLSETGVFCSGIGAETILSGFTITEAAVGVYCNQSSLIIRENHIVHLGMDSTSNDGIRLDDSSPDILYNLIAHVGGMGIRGQGDSEPQIINNTIYDYRYYAGISFSSMDVGAVSPLVMNNIIERGNDQAAAGVLWRSPADVQTLYNNVYDPANSTGTGGYYAYHDGASWIEAAPGAGAISADPMFVDETHDFFQLDPASPCVDAGEPSAQYNDLDGTRNDMGAFGGARFEIGPDTHAGVGFIFTSIGKVPLTEIVSDASEPSHGLLRVSDETADDLSIPRFYDAAFGGKLFLHGMFGAGEDVDYYQVLYTDHGGSIASATPMNDSFSKVKYTINPDGTVHRERVQMGPQTIDGVPNLYRLNKGGYWSHSDLRMVWNTAGLNGKYDVYIKAYRLAGPDDIVEAPQPANPFDQFTLVLNNEPVEVRIDNIEYADSTTLAECENIRLAAEGDQSLIFTITAWHPSGFLRNVVLDSYWGANRFGGTFMTDRYRGANDSVPPAWSGYDMQRLAPLRPVDGSGAPMAWNDCAYRFRLHAVARITNGVHYISWNTDNDHHSVRITDDVMVNDWLIHQN